MTKFLYWIVELISKAHTFIMHINDTYEYEFTDKELHFIIIGLLGIFLIIIIYPIFKHLAKKNHFLTLTGIYVFTLIVVITFAIEIGQKITNTGNMEFADVLFGITGFVSMYIGLAVIVGIIKFITSIIKKHINKVENKNNG